jgi:hypothetical protein
MDGVTGTRQMRELTETISINQTKLAREIVRKHREQRDFCPVSVYRADERGEHYIHWIDASDIREGDRRIISPSKRSTNLFIDIDARGSNVDFELEITG